MKWEQNACVFGARILYQTISLCKEAMKAEEEATCAS